MIFISCVLKDIFFSFKQKDNIKNLVKFNKETIKPISCYLNTININMKILKSKKINNRS